MRGRVLAPPGRESPSQQVFGLGINQAGAPSQPTWGQWPLLRLSPLPLRVSSGFAPDSLTQPRWVRLARIGPYQRRGGAEVPVVHGVRIDNDSRRAWLGDRELQLTTKEFDLLRVLVRDAGKVVTREPTLEDAYVDLIASTGEADGASRAASVALA